MEHKMKNENPKYVNRASYLVTGGSLNTYTQTTASDVCNNKMIK